jgi:hypothetical protein
VEERNGARADRTLVELDARVQLVQGAAEVAAGQLDALVGDAVAGAHVFALQSPGDLAGPLVQFGERGQPGRLGERDRLRG